MVTHVPLNCLSAFYIFPAPKSSQFIYSCHRHLSVSLLRDGIWFTALGSQAPISSRLDAVQFLLQSRALTQMMLAGIEIKVCSWGWIEKRKWDFRMYKSFGWHLGVVTEYTGGQQLVMSAEILRVTEREILESEVRWDVSNWGGRAFGHRGHLGGPSDRNSQVTHVVHLSHREALNGNVSACHIVCRVCIETGVCETRATSKIPKRLIITGKQKAIASRNITSERPADFGEPGGNFLI